MTSTNHSHFPDFPQTAEDWFVRLRAADCSSSERAAFSHWHAADPENAGRFAEIEYLHDAAAQLADDPLIRAATRAAKRKSAVHRQRLGWLAAAAAMVGAIGLGVYHYRVAPAGSQYASDTTPRTIVLADGTRMQLDAASSVTLRISASQRLLELQHGRVELVVAADAARPFEVHAGAATIRDIGTTFQVSRDARGVDVALLDGRVEVSGKHAGQAWRKLLDPEQRVQIDPNGIAGAVEALDMAAAQGWPEGQLVFHQRRLDDLLAEANRYAPLQLRLADPSLGSLRVSGSIRAGDQQTLLKALERGWQLSATRTGPEQVSIQRENTSRPR